MPRTAAAACAALAVALGSALLSGPGVLADTFPVELRPFADSTGLVQTTIAGTLVDDNNPFFQALGTNGRACATCHQASDGWTLTPSHLQARFAADGGLSDPVFRLVDGANCSSVDVSTEAARRQAYSLLLSKGLIRISLPVPSTAQFSVVGIEDPYGCSTGAQLSMYRRPLPAANLKFLSTVMWDGRETAAGASLADDLRHQAIDATLGHEEAFDAPTDLQLAQIVDFETRLFTAQVRDNNAQELFAAGATGGPLALSRQSFSLGINDPLDPNGDFSPNVFSLFDAWASSPDAARQAVARGQAIFNQRPITIAGVAGLNDRLHAAQIPGTCTTCHNTPNAGDHSVPLPLNIGISDASRRTPDLPLYTLQCNASGEIVQTSDPGRAMITGRCEDIGKVKGPVLRGLAARAPYFHNGSAATLDDVVNFYNQRFNLGLTTQQKNDLVAFLRSL